MQEVQAGKKERKHKNGVFDSFLRLTLIIDFECPGCETAITGQLVTEREQIIDVC